MNPNNIVFSRIHPTPSIPLANDANSAVIGASTAAVKKAVGGQAGLKL